MLKYVKNKLHHIILSWSRSEFICPMILVAVMHRSDYVSKDMIDFAKTIIEESTDFILPS
jgi:hypothetical protein